jgi:NADH dehydrogenase (ubiquinone) Fe-S protein 1
VDVESVCALRDLIYRQGSDNLEVRTDAPKLSADFRSNYLMNSRVSGIDESDLLVIIGSNPRNDCPVLNARIRSYVNKGLKVAVIGTAADLSYDY